MLMFLFALLLQAPSIDGDFVPVLHHATRTPAEWLAELETTGGSSARAVWALHYSGDRSQGVVEGLERWLHESEDFATRRAIDTVLVDWGVDVEALSAARFAEGEAVVGAADVLPMPTMFEQMSVDELVQELDSGDHLRIASASAALILRRAEVQRALVALVDVPSDNPSWDVEAEGTRWGHWRKVERPPLNNAAGICRWIRKFVGSAYVAALASELDRAKTHVRRMTMLRAIEALRWDDISPAVRSLEQLLEGEGEEARLANSLWLRTMGLYGAEYHRGPANDRELHVFHIDRDERPNTEEQASLDRVWGARLERAIASDNVTPVFLNELHSIAIASTPLGERCKILLEPLIERDDVVGLEALRILCHLRAATSRARERYLEVLSTWSTSGRSGVFDIPCWPEHDEVTLAALERFATEMGDASMLQEPLRFASVLDGTRTPIVQRMITDNAPAQLHSMISQGFLGRVTVSDDWLPVQRINAIALNLATAASRGEDCTQLEAEFIEVPGRPYDHDGKGGYGDYVQWGFYHASVLGLASPAIVELALAYAADRDAFWPDGTHNSAANDYLDSTRLSLEHEVRARAILPFRPPGLSDWTGLSLVVPIDGGVSRRETSIELVPAMRLALYGGNVRAIRDVLAVTRATERDLDYLLATLERGTAGDRISVLELIEEHTLDSPRIAAAVRRARDDLDDETAEAARRLCAERGW